jgi:hypothetical protein
MIGQPETEQLQNFEERLGHWVSSQGFWFQLRYSLSGGGVRGAFTFHLLRLAARAIIFLLIVALGTWIYLIRQGSGTSFRQDVSDAMKDRLRVEEIQIRGLARAHGEFSISRLAMLGGEDTFFSAFEARTLKCKMGLLDGFKSQWDPGIISISRLDLGLRAGADSAEAAESIGKVIFQEEGMMKLSTITVNDATLRWGYSERTRGSITGSKMWVQKTPEGWKIRFRGGRFSQNWLKRLEIEELDVLVGRDGLVFEKAVFKKDEGYVIFHDTKVKAGERPEVTGRVNLNKVNIATLVPVSVRNYLEGRLSAELTMFGSTNSVDGVGLEGVVTLGGDDLIVLRDRVHVLRALSVVDAFNNYRRLDFNNGAFRMKTHGGRMEIRELAMQAGDLLTMEGEMTVRLPTAEEALTYTESAGAEEGILSDDELEITLETAARNAPDDVAFGEGDGSLFDRLGLSIENARLEEKAAERLARSYRYEGMFNVSLPGNAFLRTPRLQESYPRFANGRVIVPIPLEGVLYDLTLKQAADMYEKAEN